MKLRRIVGSNALTFLNSTVGKRFGFFAWL